MKQWSRWRGIEFGVELFVVRPDLRGSTIGRSARPSLADNLIQFVYYDTGFGVIFVLMKESKTSSI